MNKTIIILGAVLVMVFMFAGCEKAKEDTRKKADKTVSETVDKTIGAAGRAVDAANQKTKSDSDDIERATGERVK